MGGGAGRAGKQKAGLSQAAELLLWKEIQSWQLHQRAGISLQAEFAVVGKSFCFLHQMLWCCLCLQPFFTCLYFHPQFSHSPWCVLVFCCPLCFPVGSVTVTMERKDHLQEKQDSIWFGQLWAGLLWACSHTALLSTGWCPSAWNGSGAVKLPFPREVSHFAEDVQWDSSEMTIVLTKQRATCKKRPQMDQQCTKSKFTGVPRVQETLGLQGWSHKLI